MGDEKHGASRLGKRELGPHAFEHRMPDRIKRKLRNEGSTNKLSGVVPVLVVLIEKDDNVERAYLCHPSAVQVYRLRTEGNHFCAYRNMQMLLSDASYSVLDLQDLIEKAWDLGYNPHGRIETGGIKASRKHVGTSEAQALLHSLGIACNAYAFKGKNAYKELLDSIEQYFTSSNASTTSGKVYQTQRHPLFLQRPRHSLTIIGLELTRSGARRLLVFDPAYRPPRAMGRPLEEKPHWLFRWWVLKRYRRDVGYLKGFENFETLRVDRAL